jgi:hypothetical protein
VGHSHWRGAEGAGDILGEAARHPGGRPQGHLRRLVSLALATDDDGAPFVFVTGADSVTVAQVWWASPVSGRAVAPIGTLAS